MDRILVPVDGSENSEKGLRYACWLADKVRGTITVLYVVPLPFGGESAGFPITPLRSVGQMILNKAKEIVKKENCEASKFVLREGTGNPGHEIATFCEEENISLIVMSARGHTRLDHLLIGSTSDMLAHHAPCPILIVR